MPRFCSGQRGGHCFQVAHFADQNDIGILAQCRAQRRRERWRIAADLDLFDDRMLISMLILDRVFDRDDVPRFVSIDLADEGGQRGRFA